MVSLNDFSCFRDDRANRIGGGVAIWCKHHLQPQQLRIVNKPQGIEIAAIKLRQNMVVIGAYIPPQIVLSNHEGIIQYFVDFIDSFLNMNPNFEIILCGDFNRLNLDSICNACNLRNLHDQPTYGEAQLDYILLSEDIANFYSVLKEVPIDESNVPHSSLLALPTSVVESNFKVPHAVYDLRSSHVKQFVNELELVDWSFVDSSINLDDKCQKFHEHLQLAFDASIPVNYVTFTEKTKPWITPLVKHMINERWQAYRVKNFPLYNHLKKKIKKEIDKSKLIWSKKIKRQNVWKTVHEIRGKKGDSMKSLYCKYGTIEAAADVINQKLVDVFSKKTHEIVQLPTSEQREVPISEVCVYNLLRQLQNDKASPDIPTKLYKMAAPILAGPLALLFNQSIKEATVPAIWKMSTVVPLPKTSKPVSVDDVRPISLIPIPTKLLEKAVLNFAKPHFLRHYGEDQFGFRPRSSTTCALVSLHDHITRSMEKQSVTGVQVISYDFSKAFDRLRHDIIIERISECKLPKTLICWLSSYLNTRLQCVKIGCVRSSYREVTSGVPQGSVLGPFLFSVVMGSLEIGASDCAIVKYADDVTLSVPIYRDCDNTHVVRIHESIKNWSVRFDLPLNEKKCKSLGIPRSRSFKFVTLPNVTQVQELMLLGVTFNERCTWTNHIESVTKKASRRLFPLRLLRPLLDDEELKVVYYGLMRSILEYASPLFIGLSETDAQNLAGVQKRFHRLLCGKQCKKECLQPLEIRRKNHAVSLYCSLLKEDHILHRLARQQSTHGRLLLPSISTSRRLNCFPVKTAILYNELLRK